MQSTRDVAPRGRGGARCWQRLHPQGLSSSKSSGLLYPRQAVRAPVPPPLAVSCSGCPQDTGVPVSEDPGSCLQEQLGGPGGRRDPHKEGHRQGRPRTGGPRRGAWVPGTGSSSSAPPGREMSLDLVTGRGCLWPWNSPTWGAEAAQVDPPFWLSLPPGGPLLCASGSNPWSQDKGARVTATGRGRPARLGRCSSIGTRSLKRNVRPWVSGLGAVCPVSVVSPPGRAHGPLPAGEQGVTGSVYLRVWLARGSRDGRQGQGEEPVLCRVLGALGSLLIGNRGNAQI